MKVRSGWFWSIGRIFLYFLGDNMVSLGFIFFSGFWVLEGVFKNFLWFVNFMKK